MAEPSVETIKYWKQCYQTPVDFLRWFEREILPMFDTPTVKHRRFTLDACAEPWNAKCGEFIAPPGTMACPGMIGVDGLKTDWVTSDAVWCNPGFSDLWPWTRQARIQGDAGRFSVVLSHAAHSPDWAQWTIEHASACVLINPRINFDEDPRLVNYLALSDRKPSGNSLDSMAWVFDPNWDGPCRFINPPPWRERKGKRKEVA